MKRKRRRKLTASTLRANVYRVLDQVLETGIAVEVVRRGRIVRIVPGDSSQRRKLDRLVPHPKALTGDPEDIVHLDWSGEWRP